MILVDTSAWIEFLRGTGSQVGVRVGELLRAEQAATTDVIVMEVVAGARDTADEHRLLRLLDRCQLIATQGPQDYEDAAAISRVCRQEGDRVRWLPDCLIASVAIRAEVAVLTTDTDFEAIARHTPLQLAEA